MATPLHQIENVERNVGGLISEIVASGANVDSKVDWRSISGSRSTEWRIHIGAHKTATTHLQDTLANCRTELFGAGIDYIPRDLMRSVRIRSGWSALRQTPLGRAIGRRTFQRALSPLMQGPRVVAISEENLIGTSRGLLTPLIYPDAAKRLAPFEALARISNVRLFLSIRRFDEVLPAAYVQTLKERRAHDDTKRGFEPIRKNALQNPPRWFDLVARLKAILPSADLKIWKFEDYVRCETDVMTAFCGVKVQPIEPLPPPKETRTPSAHAVAKLESVDSTMSVEDRRIAVERVMDEDDGRSKFQPFSAEERLRLGEYYCEDIERLQSEYPGIFLKL